MTTTKNLVRLTAGRYQHSSGAVIEKRPTTRVGRNGFQLAGWAIVRDGREVGYRFNTLARAAEEAGA